MSTYSMAPIKYRKFQRFNSMLDVYIKLNVSVAILGCYIYNYR